MQSSTDSEGTQRAKGAPDKMRVIVLGSVMLFFLSYWRVAAVVLCDLASTAYYIGGIVEQSVGPAAPWFILAVLLFSYAVRSMYIESSALFVRGGVYRVVKEAMGGFMAKLSVSALMFDYVLTGPISGVSASQYLMGLLLEIAHHVTGKSLDPAVAIEIKNWGSVAVASLITLYFLWQNLDRTARCESSDKALKIMAATYRMMRRHDPALVWYHVGSRRTTRKHCSLATRSARPGRPSADRAAIQSVGIPEGNTARRPPEHAPDRPNWLTAIGRLGCVI